MGLPASRSFRGGSGRKADGPVVRHSATCDLEIALVDPSGGRSAITGRGSIHNRCPGRQGKGQTRSGLAPFLVQRCFVSGLERTSPVVETIELRSHSQDSRTAVAQKRPIRRVDDPSGSVTVVDIGSCAQERGHRSTEQGALGADKPRPTLEPECLDQSRIAQRGVLAVEHAGDRLAGGIVNPGLWVIFQ